jgi:hypothetical protein
MESPCIAIAGNFLSEILITAEFPDKDNISATFFIKI